MTNLEFIARLKVARFNLHEQFKTSSFQLLNACQEAGIRYGKHVANRNAIFADEKFASVDYLKNFSENKRYVVALEIINASIKALKLEIKNNT